jgi:ribonuclease/clavin/mitogillin
LLEIRDHGPVTEVRMASGFLGRGLYWVSAFLTHGVLFDTGPPRTAGELKAWLASRMPEVVALTHHHEDHVGGASGLPVSALAPSLALERLAHPPSIQRFRRVAWGRSGPCRARRLATDFDVAGRSVRVVATPGHSDDHVVFLLPDDGWVFGGDLFIHERVRYAQADENIPRAMRSIQDLLNLDFEVLFCGHSGRVPEAKPALRRKVQFLEDVQGEAVALHAEGLQPGAIARRIFGTLGTWHWITRGWFSEVNLIRSLLFDHAD